MPRKKTLKIREAQTFPNVFDPATKNPTLDWPAIFGNANPIILELGCGTGAYTVALALANPNCNVIGVDTKGARLWQGAKDALADRLPNAAFLRLDIVNIATVMTPGSVQEIWITFPDPYPRKRQAKHRLTAPRFLALYRQILAPGGVVHLKTDDPALFDYSLEIADFEGARVEHMIENVYAHNHDNPLLAIQTTFEKKHLARGRTIHYLSFTL